MDEAPLSRFSTIDSSRLANARGGEASCENVRLDVRDAAKIMKRRGNWWQRGMGHVAGVAAPLLKAKCALGLGPEPAERLPPGVGEKNLENAFGWK